MDDSLPTEQGKKQPQEVGATVGTIIVVLLVVLGGLYFFITEVHKIQQTRAAQQAPANS